MLDSYNHLYVSVLTMSNFPNPPNPPKPFIRDANIKTNCTEAYHSNKNFGSTGTIKTGVYNQLTRLLPRHFKVLEMRLAGMSVGEVARTLEISNQSVNTIIRSPLFQSEYQRRLKEMNENMLAHQLEEVVIQARKILVGSATKAAQVQEDLLDSEDDSIRLRSSEKILDRVLGPVEGKNGINGSGRIINVLINAQEAKLLITSLQESINVDAPGTEKLLPTELISSEESPNAERDDSAADSTPAEGSTGSSEVDVHQASSECSGLGHRQAEAQTPSTGPLES